MKRNPIPVDPQLKAVMDNYKRAKANRPFFLKNMDSYQNFNPGMQYPELASLYYRYGQQVAGFTVTTQAGSTEQDLILPRTASWVLGVGFVRNIPSGNLDLVINNDKIISDLDCQALDIAGTDYPYYPFPRPIHSLDTLHVRITDTGSTQAKFFVYFIPADIPG